MALSVTYLGKTYTYGQADKYADITHQKGTGDYFTISVNPSTDNDALYSDDDINYCDYFIPYREKTTLSDGNTIYWDYVLRFPVIAVTTKVGRDDDGNLSLSIKLKVKVSSDVIGGNRSYSASSSSTSTSSSSYRTALKALGISSFTLNDEDISNNLSSYVYALDKTSTGVNTGIVMNHLLIEFKVTNRNLIDTNENPIFKIYDLDKNLILQTSCFNRKNRYHYDVTNTTAQYDMNGSTPLDLYYIDKSSKETTSLPTNILFK